jgi:hypothetical protein
MSILSPSLRSALDRLRLMLVLVTLNIFSHALILVAHNLLTRIQDAEG